MYESLTKYLPQIKNGSCGEWVPGKAGDGSPEHPWHLSYVKYNEEFSSFYKQLYVFAENHPEYELLKYKEILKNNGINYLDELKTTDVSKLDGQAIMAAFIGIARLDRFEEGTLLEYAEDGSITKWLERLKEIDNSEIQ